jgi:hypothetical protein
MNFFRKKNNSIHLEGDGNIIVQGSNGSKVFSLNLNDKESVEAFFLKFDDSINQFADLIAELKSKTEHKEDVLRFEELIDEQVVIKKYFTFVKKASELTVNDILDTRTSSFQEYYYQRPIDKIIFETLLNKKSILIIGNSLSGKTRAVYEVLRKEEFKDHLILTPRIINDFIDFPKFENIDLFRNSEKEKIIFLDDVHAFFQKENANNFLRNIIRNGITIIATCMTGPEYDLFDGAAEAKNKEGFELIEIGKMKEADLEKLDATVLKMEKDGFDGNIGSLLLSLQKMTDRYTQLKNNNSENITKLALTILDILKAFYFSANFEGKSAYSIEKIKGFYLRQINKKTVKSFTSQIEKEIHEKILKEDYENIIRNWDNAVKKLSSTYRDLNFIEKQKGELLRIEEVYFDKKVFAPDYSSEEITENIFNLYPSERERRDFGFYVQTRQFNILIAKATTYEDALAIFKRMKKEKIKPNEVTFSSLIKHTKSDPKAAITLFFESYTYEFLNPFDNRFITSFFKYFDYISLLEKYADRIIANGDPVIVYYATALERQQTDKAKSLALKLLEDVKIKNSNYYNLLGNLSKTNNVEDSIQYYLKAASLEKKTKRRAKYYHNIANLLYEQNKVEEFGKAIDYCNRALIYNKNFDYSKKLLLLLTVIETKNDDLISKLNALLKRFAYNQKKEYLKIISELEQIPEMEDKIQLLKDEIYPQNKKITP